MGILETVGRRVKKHGLGSKAIRMMPIVSLLLAFAGVGWLFSLPMEGHYRHTYMSENALLPHQASTHFRESEWHILRGFREEIRSFRNFDEKQRNENLKRLFEEMGLTAATVQNGHCETIYAILHAPRGSHNEAIVLAAPWTSANGTFNDGGVTLLVSLARYFRRWSVWHKNLIFVITGNSHDALRSWIRDYHSSLQYTAGSIEGAVVLDYPDTGEFFNFMEVHYDGLNGQLPNLDLFNTAVRVAASEGVSAHLCGLGPSYDTYKARLRTLLAGMGRQLLAGTFPGPGSEMFSGWRIDAITLCARVTDASTAFHDITTFGRIIESTVRSINNLLEHFHQSFFFYILLGPYSFVSIGSFLPAAVLLSQSYSIMAVYYILGLSSGPSWQQYGNVFLTIVIVIASSILAGILALKYTHFWEWCLMLAVLGGLASMLSVWTLRDNASRRLLIAIGLMLYGLASVTLAMLNFIEAFLLSVFLLPITWIRPRKLYNLVLLVATCPLSCIPLLARYAGVSNHELVQGVVLATTRLNVWTWYVIPALWVPLWLLGVIVS